MTKDYYKTLNINRNATQDDIKKSFRKLSKTHHPDKGGDEGVFKELSEAYDTLSDDNKKRQYDTGGQDPFGGFGHNRGGDNMDDVVNSFFGGRRRHHQQHQHQQQKRKGRSLNISLKVTLDDVYFGVTKTIKYTREVNCQGCGGTGGQTEHCRNCGGKGVIHINIGNAFFRQTQQTICPSCSGKGKKVLRVCDSCGGNERNKREQQIDFQVPKNLMTGQAFTMRDLGDEISAGENGDLQIQVVIERHPHFRPFNLDLLYEPQISVIDMVVGCNIEVPHFEGVVRAKIPELSDIGRKFTLKGKGLKGDREPGNLVIVPTIVMPKNLTEKDKEILKNLPK